MAPVPRDLDTLARQAQQALRDGTPLPSPCIGVCRIGDAGVCVGCARRLDEIGGWLHADEAGRGARLRIEGRPRDPKLVAPLELDVNFTGPLESLVRKALDSRLKIGAGK